MTDRPKEKVTKMKDEKLRGVEDLYVAAVSDALDAVGELHQVLPGQYRSFGQRSTVAGYAFTIRGARSTLRGSDERIGPRVIDEMPEGSVACYSTGGVMDIGIWGELWTTGAVARGVRGAVIDGAIRDSARIEEEDVGIFSLGTSPRDAVGRFTVLDHQIPITLNSVPVFPGDLVMADPDGVAVVPSKLIDEVLEIAERRAGLDRGMRKDLREGTSAAEAYGSVGQF